MKAGAQKKKLGMTLAEVMIAAGLLGLVMAGAWSVIIFIEKMWNRGAAEIRAAAELDSALNFVFFGGPAGGWTGVRDIVATNATLTTSTNGWVFNAGTNQLSYSKITKRITDVKGVIIGKDLASSTATLTNSGLLLTVSIVQTSAIYIVTNTASTYVQMRN